MRIKTANMREYQREYQRKHREKYKARRTYDGMTRAEYYEKVIKPRFGFTCDIKDLTTEQRVKIWRYTAYKNNTEINRKVGQYIRDFHKDLYNEILDKIERGEYVPKKEKK